MLLYHTTAAAHIHFNDMRRPLYVFKCPLPLYYYFSFLGLIFFGFAFVYKRLFLVFVSSLFLQALLSFLLSYSDWLSKSFGFVPCRRLLVTVGWASVVFLFAQTPTTTFRLPRTTSFFFSFRSISFRDWVYLYSIYTFETKKTEKTTPTTERARLTSLIFPFISAVIYYYIYIFFKARKSSLYRSFFYLFKLTVFACYDPLGFSSTSLNCFLESILTLVYSLYLYSIRLISLGFVSYRIYFSLELIFICSDSSQFHLFSFAYRMPLDTQARQCSSIQSEFALRFASALLIL